MRKIIILLAVALVMLGSFISKSEARDVTKIGYVDFSTIFDAYQKTKVLSEDLEKEGKSKKAREEKMRNEIRRLKDELELASEKAKEKKRSQIDRKIKQLQDFVKDTREELMGKRINMMKEIMEDIEAAIKEHGKSQKYDVILNDSKIMTYSNRPVLYHDKSQDVTNEIIKILNSKYKKRR